MEYLWLLNEQNMYRELLHVVYVYVREITI